MRGRLSAAPAHVLANVAPAVLAALLGDADARATRGLAAEDQHAAARGCRGCAKPRSRRSEAFAGTFHVQRGL